LFLLDRRGDPLILLGHPECARQVIHLVLKTDERLLYCMSLVPYLAKA
jgi:hypothetical protein